MAIMQEKKIPISNLMEYIPKKKQYIFFLQGTFQKIMLLVNITSDW